MFEGFLESAEVDCEGAGEGRHRSYDFGRMREYCHRGSLVTSHSGLLSVAVSFGGLIAC